MKTEKASPCEKYELAITNYVLGEKIQMLKGELFNHLRTCPNCRADLKDWQATHSVMRAEAYDSKPEVKARSEAFIKKLVNQPLPDRQAGLPAQTQPSSGLATTEVVSSLQMPEVEPLPGAQVFDLTEVGNTAHAVWHHLAKNGWVRVKDLSRTLKRANKLHPDDTKFAVGWLAYEKKVHLAKKKKDTYVYLTPLEREIYQSQAGRPLELK